MLRRSNHVIIWILALHISPLFASKKLIATKKYPSLYRFKTLGDPNHMALNLMPSRAYLYVSNLRGGGGGSSDGQHTNSVEVTSPSTPKFWGPVTNAFQMNIDAKDELIQELNVKDRDEPFFDEVAVDDGQVTTRADDEKDGSLQHDQTAHVANITMSSNHGDTDTIQEDPQDEIDSEREDLHESFVTENPPNSAEEDDNDNYELEEEYEYEIEEDSISDNKELDSSSDAEATALDIPVTPDGSVPLEDSTEIEPPSLEDIVREEWSMIPETEVEDEGREYEVRHHHQSREKSERKRKPPKEQTKQIQAAELGKIDVMQDRRPTLEVERHWPMEEKMHESYKPNAAVYMQQEKSLDARNRTQESPFISSGLWPTIDRVSSFGLSTTHEELRLSRKLRTIRKLAAHYTGLHGIVSGKGRKDMKHINDTRTDQPEELNEEDLGAIRRRLAAIEAARRRVASAAPDAEAVRAARQAAFSTLPRWRRPIARFMMRRPRMIVPLANEDSTATSSSVPLPGRYSSDDDNVRAIPKVSPPPAADEYGGPHPQRFMTEEERERVREIDRMIQEGQRRILELQIKKDALQRSPNPFYNYTTKSSPLDEGEKQGEESTETVTTTRLFNFPPERLVSEYMEELYAMGRLQKMNHTDLWKRKSSFGDVDDGDDHEEIGDDLLTPSGDARKLYQNNHHHHHGNTRRNGNNNVGGGSWLLRQSLGTGSKLGEKIGEAIENAAYRGVCSAIMAILARSIAALHGVNVMKHSDIRLFIESATDLPPVSKTIFQDGDYAKEAIGKAIRRGSKKKKRRKQQRAYQYGLDDSGDESFVQRDAVVETLISHCQISAPLLKLFPQAWQRALLGNIITLIAAVVSDFAEGVQFQILGHQLAFSFKPITEADMIQHIGVGGFRFNHRRAKPEEFEAAVRATADDISQGLGFLDRWHQRALGGDLLRAQIGNLIARVVLTLVDEVLHSARMDLWSAQVGGPRIVAGLEYRNEAEYGLDSFKSKNNNY